MYGGGGWGVGMLLGILQTEVFAWLFNSIKLNENTSVCKLPRFIANLALSPFIHRLLHVRS